jgi:nitrate reductase delta subunit
VRRLFRRGPSRNHAVTRQIAAWCLHYPDDELRRRLPLLREGVAEFPDARGLRRVLDHQAKTPPQQAEQHYVEIFDTSPRRSLYLTWFVHGDTRLRGGALAELAGVYRAHGFRVDAELPDYLPVLLEFAETVDPVAGERLLSRFRPAIELLHRNLVAVDTPYAFAVRAVLETVPDSRELEPVSAQPPTEQVGLQPFPRHIQEFR